MVSTDFVGDTRSSIVDAGAGISLSPNFVSCFDLRGRALVLLGLVERTAMLPKRSGGDV